ncbi:UDP-N-acetylglucosamine 1-carboxyvinyltransferase [Candidatus Kaiserbacteria bacterium]|nr:UDP-N-acetylglucosamine 1-carboxyvinyltransferase [Candidatus Kaiserbacteria bacterium]
MKERFVIEGLGGKKTLSGVVSIHGAKNAILPAMASAFLFKDALTIENMPDIEDVKRLTELLEGFGATVTEKSGRSCTIDTAHATKTEFDRAVAKRLRASIILTGPLLARYGTATFPYPGGCVLGQRSIDLFLQSFRAMGVEIKEENEEGDDIFRLTVTGKKLQGADIFFSQVSVTATETMMMAAVLADGTTTLRNAAMEPEIQSLADFLNSCGAHITGAGTSTITIKGGDVLSTGGRAYHTLPDRIETGSFLILGALTAHDLTIEGCVPEHVEALINLLTLSGVSITRTATSLTISNNTKPSREWKGVNVKTHEYPGFATDLQAPMVVYLTQVSGESTVFETIFEARLNYIEDLVKMGANITMWNPNKVSIKGPSILKDRELEGPDIRAGLAYVIAALVAQGTSTIDNIYYIDRGYECLETRLQQLGANIRREARS